MEALEWLQVAERPQRDLVGRSGWSCERKEEFVLEFEGLGDEGGGCEVPKLKLSRGVENAVEQ